MKTSKCLMDIIPYILIIISLSLLNVNANAIHSRLRSNTDVNDVIEQNTIDTELHYSESKNNHEDLDISESLNKRGNFISTGRIVNELSKAEYFAHYLQLDILEMFKEMNNYDKILHDTPYISDPFPYIDKVLNGKNYETSTIFYEHQNVTLMSKQLQNWYNEDIAPTRFFFNDKLYYSTVEPEFAFLYRPKDNVTYVLFVYTMPDSYQPLHELIKMVPDEREKIVKEMVTTLERYRVSGLLVSSHLWFGKLVYSNGEILIGLKMLVTPHDLVSYDIFNIIDEKCQKHYYAFGKVVLDALDKSMYDFNHLAFVNSSNSRIQEFIKDNPLNLSSGLHEMISRFLVEDASKVPCTLPSHPYFSYYGMPLLYRIYRAFSQGIYRYSLTPKAHFNGHNSWEFGILNEHKNTSYAIGRNKRLLIEREKLYKTKYGIRSRNVPVLPNVMYPVFVGLSEDKKDVVSAYQMPEAKNIDDYTSINLRNLFDSREFSFSYFFDFMEKLLFTITNQYKETPDRIMFDFSFTANNIVVPKDLPLEDVTPDDVIFVLKDTYAEETFNRHCNLYKFGMDGIGPCIASLYLEYRGFQTNCPFIQYEMENIFPRPQNYTLTPTYQFLSSIMDNRERFLIEKLFELDQPKPLKEYLGEYYEEFSLKDDWKFPNVPDILKEKCLTLKPDLKYDKDSKPISISYINDIYYAIEFYNRIKTNKEKLRITHFSLRYSKAKIVFFIQRDLNFKVDSITEAFQKHFDMMENMYLAGFTVYHDRNIFYDISVTESIVVSGYTHKYFNLFYNHGSKIQEVSHVIVPNIELDSLSRYITDSDPYFFITTKSSHTLESLGYYLSNTLDSIDYDNPEKKYVKESKIPLYLINHVLSSLQSATHLKIMMRDIMNKKYPIINSILQNEGIQLFKIADLTEEQLEKADCPICYDSDNLELDYHELDCKHIYHTKCIIEWNTISQACPLCRKSTIIL